MSENIIKSSKKRPVHNVTKELENLAYRLGILMEPSQTISIPMDLFDRLQKEQGEPFRDAYVFKTNRTILTVTRDHELIHGA